MKNALKSIKFSVLLPGKRAEVFVVNEKNEATQAHLHLVRGVWRMWYPELLVKLLHIVTHLVAMALVISGTGMLLLSVQSQRAALHAVIFFGIAAGLAWAVRAKNRRA